MSTTGPIHAPIPEQQAQTDYATQALESIVQISTATGPPELLDRLMQATVAIGASASLYTAAIPEDGPEPSCLSVFACHPAFAQAQAAQGPLLEHPWFRFARTHTTPGTDQQILIERGTDAAALGLARNYGFRSCLVVPTPSGAGLERLEMLCIGSEQIDRFEGPDARVLRALARSLAAELHDWLTHHLQHRLRAETRLRDRDIALLALEWQGLGTKAISQRTGLSSASVDSRFQRINVRLNCASRRASARRAAAYGLLESL